MKEQPGNEVPDQSPGSVAATVAALIVLAAVVVLFLLFKFNLFNGGSAPNVRSTMGIWFVVQA